jgi:hypothetical protein
MYCVGSLHGLAKRASGTKWVKQYIQPLMGQTTWNHVYVILQFPQYDNQHHTVKIAVIYTAFCRMNCAFIWRLYVNVIENISKLVLACEDGLTNDYHFLFISHGVLEGLDWAINQTLWKVLQMTTYVVYYSTSSVKVGWHTKAASIAMFHSIDQKWNWLLKPLIPKQYVKECSIR